MADLSGRIGEWLESFPTPGFHTESNMKRVAIGWTVLNGNGIFKKKMFTQYKAHEALRL